MLSNICGIAIALLVYYVLNRFFPAKEAQVAEAVHDVKDYGFTASDTEQSSLGGDSGGAGSDLKQNEKEGRAV